MSPVSCIIKTNRVGNLAYQLFFNRIRTWEGTKLKDTADNRRLLEARAVLISHEIKTGTFDYLKWFPNGNRANLFRAPQLAPLSVGGHYEKWIIDQSPPLVRKSRERDYKQHFTAYILPKFRNTPMAEIHTDTLVTFRKYLLHALGLSVKTSRNIIDSSFRAMWRDAVQGSKPVVEHDPFVYLDWPESDELEPDPFTEEERDRIIDYFYRKQRFYYPWVFIQFWTGMRPSEGSGLQVGNVDLASGRTTIVRSRTLGENNKTKTKKSKRSITLFPNVLAVLNSAPRLRVTESDHVFLNRDGRPIVPDNWRKEYWHGALTALKIRHRKFYCTRHTFISVMLSHGENIKRVADYVGTSVLMIEKHYGKLITEDTNFGQRAIAQSENSSENISRKENEDQRVQQLGERPRRDLNPYTIPTEKSTEPSESISQNTEKNTGFATKRAGEK